MMKSIARVVNVYEGATSTARTHTMTHDPVYPVMTFSEFLASKTYLGGKKNIPIPAKYNIENRMVWPKLTKLSVTDGTFYKKLL